MSAGIMLAFSAVQAVQSVGQGYAQKAESKYNAAVLEGQAGMVDIQKGIEYEQYERLKRQTRGKAKAIMAKSGIEPTGSPMAVLLDTEAQINKDQIIGQLNLDRQKRGILSQKESVLRQGKYAQRAGYMNAFSTMLKGVSNYAMYKGMFSKGTTGGPTQTSHKGVIAPSTYKPRRWS